MHLLGVFFYQTVNADESILYKKKYKYQKMYIKKLIYSIESSSRLHKYKSKSAWKSVLSNFLIENPHLSRLYCHA